MDDPPLTTAPLLGEPLPVELMNTVWADRDGVHDALVTPGDAAGWLTALRERLPRGADVAAWAKGAGEVEMVEVWSALRTLRDATRALAARRTADPRAAGGSGMPSHEALDHLNALAKTAPSWPVLQWPDGATPTVVTDQAAQNTGQMAVSWLAREAVDIIGGSRGEELRACLAPGCVLYFVRHHPRREWCSDSCGNRARQARHYQRRRD
ncbi:CGNR zinc finger domain-containing protein [Nocardioides ultimimeridianus]